MDGRRFDRLTLQVGDVLSRRHFGALLSLIGLGAGLAAASDALGKKKKKKKKCKGGKTKCGKACVNLQTDPQHCGGCNTACGGGQTCQGGQCHTGGGGCTGGLIDCNGQCVNTQTSTQHCGGCNNPCGNGETCAAGDCVSDLFCVGDQDCGGGNGNLECNRTINRCECIQKRTIGGKWGICGPRGANGSGMCGPCCPGGADLGASCPPLENRDRVCVDQTINGCQCPPSTPEGCSGSKLGFCSVDTDTDPTRCGASCADCTTSDPATRCCSGQCARGCYPGSGGSCIFLPCGSDCAPCAQGEKCCNQGIGTPDVCLPQNGDPICRLT